MHAEALLIEFRYLALVIGQLLEGEAVLLLAAFLAQRGYLYLPAVILIIFLVTYTVDLFFFWIGHQKGKQFLAKRPTWAHKVEKAKALMAGNLDLLVLGSEITAPSTLLIKIWRFWCSLPWWNIFNNHADKVN